MTKNDWPNNCVREWSARKPCEISYLSFLSFRCDFARECFCEIRTWIVVYRELQKRQKQHLTPLVNYKGRLEKTECRNTEPEPEPEFSE